MLSDENKPNNGFFTLPPGWRMVPLGNLCTMNPRRPPIQRSANTPTTFITMTAVDEGGKGIASAEVRPFGEVSKGYTYFEEGDVLFAKITPCMQNGKHAVVRGTIDGFGFGSTEFHVIRPGKGVLPEWIHMFVRQPKILADAVRHMTGAVGQQRVPAAYLSALELPLPPVDEQKRIVAILTEQMEAVERARVAAEVQLEAARTLPAVYLRTIFGAILDGSRRARLGDVLRLRKDVVHPHDHPVGPATFVGLEHIQSGTGQRTGLVDIEMSKLTGRKPKFYQGDILYGYLRPYLNKVWLADFDGLCSVDQYVYSVAPDRANAEYIAWFMMSPVYLERAPVTTTPGQLPRIRTEEVAFVELDLPSLSDQRHIVSTIRSRMKNVDRVRGGIEAQTQAIKRLPSVLLRQAFSGELSKQHADRAINVDTVREPMSAIAAYLVNRLHDHESFGRLQLSKGLFLTEAYVGAALGGAYGRWQWGPYYGGIRELEEEAEQRDWFATRKRRNGTGFMYHPGPAIAERVRAAETLLKDRKQGMDRLLDLMESLTARQMEVAATLYAVWNDFLLDGHDPTDEEIMHDMWENWHPNKERFHENTLRYRLAWLRDNQLVPRGIGPHTEASSGN